MKRSANDDYQHDTVLGPDRGNYPHNLPQFDGNFGKRSRMGPPPRIIGPLTFNSSGDQLQQALLPAERSDMPGVYRLAVSAPVIVRLWSPQWPQTQYLECGLNNVLESIDQKCVFIFDPRRDESESFLGGLNPLLEFLQTPIIHKQGLVVSVCPPPPALASTVFNSSNLPVSYVQDPSGELARMCRFDTWLGPSAVLVKNNSVVSTLLLQRRPEAVLQTLQEWESI